MKKRADLLLVERGLVESRSRAAAIILAGKVFSGERRIEKAGDLLAEDSALELRGQDHPWVSRGGVKLAYKQCGIDHGWLVVCGVQRSASAIHHISMGLSLFYLDGIVVAN